MPLVRHAGLPRTRLTPEFTCYRRRFSCFEEDEYPFASSWEGAG